MKDHYNDVMFLNNQNGKSEGTNIQNIDTIRGCPLNCESCYAKKLSAISVKTFSKPINIKEFTGKVHDDRVYRIGNYGDPCIDWSHSESIVTEYRIFNNFIVTKLTTLEGFTGLFKRLQVSVDTLNLAHYKKTLENVWKLKRDFPDVKIVLRIRSLSSHRPDLMLLQQEAVIFANQFGLPILDTRLRFQKKDAIQRYDLVEEDYEWRGSFLRPVHGKVFIRGSQKYYDCDLYGNHCKDCKNCEITWHDKQFNRNGAFIADHRNKNRSKYSDVISSFANKLKYIPRWLRWEADLAG